MNSNIVSALLLLALIPAASGVACYVCSNGGNCNDPFTSTVSSLASGVNITSGCGACVKSGLNSVMTRSCVSICPSVTIFLGGTGTACCSNVDYCNAAPSLQKTSFKALGLLTSILVLGRTTFV